MRRVVSRRRGLVKRRTQVKNEIAAVLHRNLKPRPPVSDLFGKQGRVWLGDQQLPIDERLTVDAALRQLDFITDELAQIDKLVAEAALTDQDVLRLMTIPGVDVTTAVTMVAVIGDVRRFKTPRHLVGYLGLHPRIRQSGNGPAHHGRLSKEGSAAARHVLVEAAWIAARARDRSGRSRSGPRRAAAARSRQSRSPASSPCSAGILTKDEDYAFARPSLVRRKHRALELKVGAPRAKPGPNPNPNPVRKNQSIEDQELAVAQQAEDAYRRLIADWQATGRKRGAGATKERASIRPSTGKAAPQAVSS